MALKPKMAAGAYPPTVAVVQDVLLFSKNLSACATLLYNFFICHHIAPKTRKTPPCTLLETDTKSQ